MKHDGTGADALDVVAGQGRQRPPRGSHNAAVDSADGHVDVQVVVHAPDPLGQGFRIADDVGGDGGQMARGPLGDVLYHGAARAEREREGSRHAGDDQDRERVKIDLAVQPHAISPRPGSETDPSEIAVA